MKRLTLKILALVMAIILILPFIFACTDEDETPSTSSTKAPEKTFDEMNEKEKAFYILNLDYEEENVRQEMTMNVSSVMEGFAFTLTATAVEIECGIGTNNYKHYLNSEMYMDLGFYSSSSKEVSGYFDGVMFEALHEDNINQYSYKSNISQADYIAYNESLEEDDNDNFGITKNNCRTATCVQDENGNWIATFSDFSGSALEELQEMVDGLADTSTLVDGKIILTVDSNLRPVSAAIEFVFEGTEVPEMSAQVTYQFGNEVIMPDMNLNSFTQVDDLRKME